jgi:putative ABC transport system permease protein
VVLGVVVGIAVAGQTFYLFVNDNLRYLAALKAMGATNGRLALMVASQAANVGFLGFGLGAGVAALFGFGALKDPDFPFILPWLVIAFAAAITVFICLVSGAIALRRIVTIEPATVFK